MKNAHFPIHRSLYLSMSLMLLAGCMGLSTGKKRSIADYKEVMKLRGGYLNTVT
ncbi:hypothetical protein JCM10512_1620 [Bacteroides reticulotermitis JCM 10512]|uniref:Uncharacterized protein n=1 Tax=Bacteroides reticulotermitis JCM 10512 TaxID=1445607 RepID=W4URD3_9BACE|nr:hypothetical protein JCM10512_1620 [Bacteroides reticulotermitis JCM 10512]